ncbi:MAG: hypothetical protein ABI208_03130, partial [Ginsengibacter sp.]
MKKSVILRYLLFFLFIISFPTLLLAQVSQVPEVLNNPDGSGLGILLLIILLVLSALLAVIYLSYKTAALRNMVKKASSDKTEKDLEKIIRSLNQTEVDNYLKYTQIQNKNKSMKSSNSSLLTLTLILLASFFSTSVFAQTPVPTKGSIFSEGGIIITLFLIFVPILVGIILMTIKVGRMTKKFKMR